jgi:hypothetical protein
MVITKCRCPGLADPMLPGDTRLDSRNFEFGWGIDIKLAISIILIRQAGRDEYVIFLFMKPGVVCCLGKTIALPRQVLMPA